MRELHRILNACRVYLARRINKLVFQVLNSLELFRAKRMAWIQRIDIFLADRQTGRQTDRETDRQTDR